MPQITKKYQLKRAFSILLISTFILLLSACAEMDSHSSISRFQKSEDVYRASMRWGEWSNTFQLMRDKPGSDNSTSALKPLTDEYLTYLETIKVKHIEVIRSGMNEKEGSGESKFDIEFHFDHSVKIKSVRHTVSWWYDQETNYWFTNTPLPEAFNLPKKTTIKLSPKKK